MRCFLLIIVSILLGVFTTVRADDEPFELSKHAQFSLLTCGPGEELYTAFGHTAIRLQDDSVNIDITFNYGTFDFNTPNFYLKFMNGELDYLLSVSQTERFFKSYQRENREVREAVILLSPEEKSDLWERLYTNMLPENRAYRYDFFFDNCATRVRDLLFSIKGLPLDYESTGVTYRELIHEKNTSDSWSAQGIDLLLGANTDSIASKNGRTFLPDYLEAMCLEKGIIDQPKTILPQGGFVEEETVNIPNLLFFSLFILTVAYTVYQFVRRSTDKVYDYVLFTATILLSLLFAYMWFVSSHLICKWNWNVLWASPLLILLLIDIIRENPIKRIVVNICLLDASLVAFIMLSAFSVESFSNIAWFSAGAIAVRINYILYYTCRQSICTFSKK